MHQQTGSCMSLITAELLNNVRDIRMMHHSTSALLAGVYYL